VENSAQDSNPTPIPVVLPTIAPVVPTSRSEMMSQSKTTTQIQSLSPLADPITVVPNSSNLLNESFAATLSAAVGNSGNTDLTDGSKRLDIGKMAGIIAGAILLFFLAILLVLWRRYCSLHRQKYVLGGVSSAFPIPHEEMNGYRWVPRPRQEKNGSSNSTVEDVYLEPSECTAVAQPLPSPPNGIDGGFVNESLSVDALLPDDRPINQRPEIGAWDNPQSSSIPEENGARNLLAAPMPIHLFVARREDWHQRRTPNRRRTTQSDEYRYNISRDAENERNGNDSQGVESYTGTASNVRAPNWESWQSSDSSATIHVTLS
jgi:hypothetical protein